jgi:uncharacterized protein (DUF4213/DUF364 family)
MTLGGKMDLLVQALNILREDSNIVVPENDNLICVHPLNPSEAIGDECGEEFVLSRGYEVMLEARIGENRGQAFTDRKSEWSGTVSDIFDFDFSVVSQRAMAVAALNAILAANGFKKACHCKGKDPIACGEEAASYIEKEYGRPKIGIIGLQPSMLQAFVNRFGADKLMVLDLNTANVDQHKNGVLVKDGEVEANFQELLQFCDLGWITGSTLVNATMNSIVPAFKSAGKQFVFFGNTAAGVCHLLNLPHFCPYGK